MTVTPSVPPAPSGPPSQPVPQAAAAPSAADTSGSTEPSPADTSRRAAAVTPSVREAYKHCEQVTRTQARNFAWGILLLPPAQRRALSAVYALARRIDDIGDGDLPADRKLAELRQLRGEIATTTPDSPDPVLAAVGDAAHRFPLPMSAFDDLLDGVEMDVRGDTYPDFDTLVRYCRRVAGSIGRLSLGVYGCTDPDALRRADDLGVALQQTNVLRDVREDLHNHRVYLPGDELTAAGITLQIGADGRLGGPAGSLIDYLRSCAERAATWYDIGLPVLDALDRRSAACTAAMAGIYLRLNRRFAADPTPILERRLSLPGREKAAVAVRALAGRRP
jgi:phytoene synthase